MFWRKKQRIPDDRLDRVAQEITRAAVADNAEEVVSSPFLYSKLRARIEAEQERRAEPVNGWLVMLAAARLAIPALAIIAIAVTAMFWFGGASAPPESAANVPYINMPEMGYGGIAPIQACSVSDSAGCNVSTNEVIATLFREEGQELR
ncbi:MAG: hypothetical protein L0229_13895 [Blastocatellia bacterium]|nr:hypothetical protein [Blastocatellia bacterium]